MKCNVNLVLTEKVPIIVHNLKVYESHLIMNELNKFSMKVDVIHNELEKYMAFTINKNLIFIDSKQLMNSSQEKLVKKLSNDDSKYFSRVWF